MTTQDDGQSGPKGNENPSDQNSPNESDVFKKGYGAGAQKARSEVADLFGVSSFDDVKVVAKKAKDQAESDKSASQKLADSQTELARVKAEREAELEELNSYRDTVKKEAEGLYSGLSAEDRAVIDSTGVPKEKQLPILRRLATASNKVQTKNNVGGPANTTKTNEGGAERPDASDAKAYKAWATSQGARSA